MIKELKEMQEECLRRIIKMLRNRAVYEIVKEELEIWEGHKKFYLKYSIYPEVLQFNQQGWCYRKNALKQMKDAIKRIDKVVKQLLTSDTFKHIKKYSYKTTKDPESEEELKRAERFLEKHLQKLREMRKKRDLQEEEE